VDDRVEAHLSGRRQHQFGATDVDRVHLPSEPGRVGEDVGGVDDGITTVHGATNPRSISDIPFYRLGDLRTERFQGSAQTLPGPHEGPHCVAGANEGGGRVGSHEPGGSREKDPHPSPKIERAPPRAFYRRLQLSGAVASLSRYKRRSLPSSVTSGARIRPPRITPMVPSGACLPT